MSVVPQSVQLFSQEPSTVIVPIGAKTGHFAIQSLLGEGSFGTVFKAWDPELLRHVALKVPTNSLGNWTILPLDERTREPVSSAAIRISRTATAETQLEPGEYLVFVEVPNFGFHEVYRYVPEDPKVNIKSMYAHRRWDADTKNRVVLPPVSIRATSDTIHGMIPVPAGTIVMGDGKADRPEHSREMSAFFWDPHEVTVDELQKLMPLGTGYSFPLESYPVSVHWNKAIAYAEALGKRLLKEDEFEYLAQNQGCSPDTSNPELQRLPGIEPLLRNPQIIMTGNQNCFSGRRNTNPVAEIVAINENGGPDDTAGRLQDLNTDVKIEIGCPGGSWKTLNV